MRIPFDNRPDPNEDNERGSLSYPLAETFTQVMASQQSVPIFGGLSAVPMWPDFTAVNTQNTYAARARVVEWLTAVLMPHPGPGHAYPTVDADPVDAFATTLRELEKGEWRLAGNKGEGSGLHYVPPPGFDFDASQDCMYRPPGSGHVAGYIFQKLQSPSDASLRYHNEDFDAMNATQRILALYMASLAKGFRRYNKNERRMQKQWRGRGAQSWAMADAEKALFPAVYVRNQRYDPEDRHDPENPATDADITDFNIDALQAQSDADALLHTNAAFARLVAFLDVITRAHGVVRDTSTSRTIVTNNAASPFPSFGANVVSQDDIATVTARIKDNTKPDTFLPAVPPNLHPAAGVATGNSARGPASRALEELQARPTGAPNAGQVAGLRIMADHFDSIHAARPAAPETPAPFIFLQGAGGTGKSFFFSCLEVLAHSIGHHIAPTAMTGVACTAIPTQQGARTTQSCFKLGINPHKIQELGDIQHTILTGALGQTVAVIIDEISFAKAWILGAVDK